MKCFDCRGSGLYVGLGFYPAETCKRCNGTGNELGASLHSAEQKLWANYSLDDVSAKDLIDRFWKGEKNVFPEFIRLVQFNSSNYYVLIGSRSTSDLMEFLSKDIPSQVAMDYAQKQYLALYRRRGRDNHFIKTWSA